jgi:hypothetical protein
MNDFIKKGQAFIRHKKSRYICTNVVFNGFSYSQKHSNIFAVSFVKNEIEYNVHAYKNKFSISMSTITPSFGYKSITIDLTKNMISMDDFLVNVTINPIVKYEEYGNLNSALLYDFIKELNFSYIKHIMFLFFGV